MTTTASIHRATPDQISASVGYSDGAQSHLRIESVTWFVHSESTSKAEGLAAIRKLISEAQRLEAFLAAEIEPTCTQCGRALHDGDPSNTGLGRHVDCTVDGALAGQPT